MIEYISYSVNSPITHLNTLDKKIQRVLIFNKSMILLSLFLLLGHEVGLYFHKNKIAKLEKTIEELKTSKGE